MKTKPIAIIDTDPGQDDALAILLMIRSRKVDVKAITTVAGNVDLQKTTNNARFVLDLIDSDIPIFSGSERPLKREPVRANVHGISGLSGVKVIKKEPLNGLAVDQIIRIVKRNPKKVSIVVIGPQTNIAKAFMKDPLLPKKIKQLVIMGGAINVPGNKSAVAEFNIFSDPEAAKIVFDSQVKKVLIPLDVCNKIPLFLGDFNRIVGRLNKPILSIMTRLTKGIERFENFKGALIYDALAGYYLINPKAFRVKKMDTRIETKGDLTYGMTVADRRQWGKIKKNVNIAVGLSRRKFISDFVRILSD
jgi:inosine-uridine nucleoside N-ribohydrolase